MPRNFLFRKITFAWENIRFEEKFLILISGFFFWYFWQ